MEIFQDQSHIDRIRDALWTNYGNGASVMVGSGFSRNALNVRPGADDPPILTDVAKEFHGRLYPTTGEAGRHAKVPESILAGRIPSLAQEYEAAFGRGDLHQLLQQMIRDEDQKPGEAHSRVTPTSLARCFYHKLGYLVGANTSSNCGPILLRGTGHG